MTKPIHLEARRALGLNQRETALLLGISKRTVQRWDAGRAAPYSHDYCALATAVFPHDQGLAARLAQLGGTTLEALGVAVQPPSKQGPTMEYLMDTLVSVAAVAGDSKPAAIRPAVAAAFTFARQFGLSLETVESALAGGGAKAAKAKA
jgi:transcriptional regulator with XRE-family HTH domain